MSMDPSQQNGIFGIFQWAITGVVGLYGILLGIVHNRAEAESDKIWEELSKQSDTASAHREFVAGHMVTKEDLREAEGRLTKAIEKVKS